MIQFVQSSYMKQITLISCLFFSLVGFTQTCIDEQLAQLFPNATITALEKTHHFKACYQLVLQQQVDHFGKNNTRFDQYIYLSHVDVSKPLVIVTEGYSARQTTYELTQLLESNQVIVEYRFYGKSRPDSIPWDYLTNRQAIEDLHGITKALKKLYTGKTITTGISKGGETTLIYKTLYPKDADVAIPYVAPLIHTREDPRTQAHIDLLGRQECGDKILEFQRAILERREELLPLIEQYAASNSLTFNEMKPEEALEYAALEFPFSFWQWNTNCAQIPDKGVTAEELFQFLNKTVGIGYYSDQEIFDLLPSYYQHEYELGYYGFDPEPLKDLLKIATQPSNLRFLPPHLQREYDPTLINQVRKYSEKKGNKILYIYGEKDPWGACSPTPGKKTDALKMVLKGGTHTTRIHHFSREEREQIYQKLEEWLGPGAVTNKK